MRRNIPGYKKGQAVLPRPFRCGARSIEKERLYLALEPGKCTIRKAKIFRQKDRNPNGLSIAFKIVGGVRFMTDAAGWSMEERYGEGSESG